MSRYYVTFSHQGLGGLGIGAMDWNTSEPITEVQDLAPIQEFLVRNGYVNVAVLSFSLYGSKQPTSQRGNADSRASRRR